MKKIITISAVLCVCACAVFAIAGKQQVRPAQSTKSIPSVTFNGKKYYLQYSQGNSQQWLNEYLPAGVTFEDYTEMLTVRSYDGIKATPEQIGSSLVSNLLKTYPDTPYNFVKGAYPGEVEVSFAIAQDPTYEFNLFRITPGTNGHPVALQYVRRIILPSPADPKRDQLMNGFVTTLQKDLNTWVKSIRALMPVPAIIRTPKQ